MEPTYKLEFTKDELEEIHTAIFLRFSDVKDQYEKWHEKCKEPYTPDMEMYLNTLRTINHKIDIVFYKNSIL